MREHLQALQEIQLHLGMACVRMLCQRLTRRQYSWRAALTFYGAMGDAFCQLASGSYVFIARATASVFGPRLFW